MIILRIFALFITITLTVSGCSSLGKTYKFYSGDNVLPADVVTIVPLHEKTLVPIGRTDVYLIEIDGKFTEQYNLAIPTYKISPGKHKVKIGFFIKRYEKQVRGVDPEYMDFTAEAGHNYIVKGSFPEIISEGQVIMSFWIEDVDSKAVIAGTRPVQEE